MFRLFTFVILLTNLLLLLLGFSIGGVGGCRTYRIRHFLSA